MSIAKITEISSTSPTSFEDALQKGGMNDMELEAKFARLEGGGSSGGASEKPGGSAVDDELAALKKKIRIG